MITNIQISELRIPFRHVFRHASAERRVTQGIWVEVTLDGGARGYGEGCPREYVTGESIGSSVSFLRRIAPMLAGIDCVGSLGDFVHSNREMIDASPAAWCAMELALLDAMARRAGESLEVAMGMPPIHGRFSYTGVLGAESLEKFEKQFDQYRAMGFRDYKVKLAGDDGDAARMEVLGSHPDSFDTLRLDANNRWREPAEAIRHIRNISCPVYAVEEPVSAGDIAGSAAVAESTGLRVILDESCLRAEDLEPLADKPGLWIANLRISKMGGLFRSLGFAGKARDLGIPLIVGCQVGETCLLTRAALALVAALPRGEVIAQDGAFGTLLLSADIVDPPLQFGQGGMLDIASHALGCAPGLGIDPVFPEGAGYVVPLAEIRF